MNKSSSVPPASQSKPNYLSFFVPVEESPVVIENPQKRARSEGSSDEDNNFFVEVLHQQGIIPNLISHLSMVFNKIARDEHRKQFKHQFLEFLQWDIERQKAILQDEKYVEFCRMLHNYSYGLVGALRAKENRLTNIIQIFASLNQTECAIVENGVNNLLQNYSAQMQEGVRVIILKLLSLSQCKMFHEQEFPVNLYGKYLFAAEADFKLDVLRDINSTCINKEYLLRVAENANFAAKPL